MRIAILTGLVHLVLVSVSTALEIEVDGESVYRKVYSLEGEPDRPRTGDVVYVDAPWSVAGGDAVLFTLAGSADLKLSGGRRGGGTVLLHENRVVWARIDLDEGVLRNPLGSLSAEEARGIRGVLVQARGDGVLQSLGRLDPALVTITVGKAGTTMKADALPTLPRALRRLCVDPGPSPSFTGGFSALGHLTDLRMLVLPWDSRVPNDVLARLGSLRYLRAPDRPAAGLDALAKLTRLRDLSVSGHEVTSVAFARKLARLRRLDIDWTRVETLAPLAGHGALREIRADYTPLKELPRGALPELRLLRSVGAPVPRDREIEFRRRCPRCVLEIRRVDMLREAVATADRIRVETGDIRVRVVRRIEGRVSIDEFVSALEPTPTDDCGGYEACRCDPVVVFLRGETVLARVGFRCSGSPSWGPWDGDMEITEKSQKALDAWFRKHVGASPGSIRSELERRE